MHFLATLHSGKSCHEQNSDERIYSPNARVGKSHVFASADDAVPWKQSFYPQMTLPILATGVTAINIKEITLIVTLR